MLNPYDSSLAPKPINIHSASHVRGIVAKFYAAGLASDRGDHPLDLLERLRGTNTEPMMIVYHPDPSNDSSRGIKREHRVDEAIALLADPNGPEAQLAARREREIADAASREAARKEDERHRAAQHRQERWSAMTEGSRMLWLVAARIAGRRPYQRRDGRPVDDRCVHAMVVAAQQDLLEEMCRACAEARSDEAPDDLQNLPHFAE